jgi:hypothetical protein
MRRLRGWLCRTALPLLPVVLVQVIFVGSTPKSVGEYIGAPTPNWYNGFARNHQGGTDAHYQYTTPAASYQGICLRVSQNG